MARQLIFTSSPQGLEPGRSGYCTVARHKDIRSRLVRELERLSVYDFNQQGEGPKAQVALYRKLALGSEEFFVVTRIRDAGLDYTNRTNYLAHHLILDSFEIATVPSPAEILSNWSGWLSQWDGPPRYFDEGEEVDLSNCKMPGLIPANGWLAASNDPGNAAILVSPAMKKPVVLEVHPGQEESLLKLFAESSALLKLSLDAWDYSFTTFLQENDDARGFSWIGARGQPAAERVKQSASNYLDLREFASSMVNDPIDDDLAHVARKGPKAKATGAKSPKTRAKSPKAFSDREMAQFQKAATGYTASAAPAGSTVSAQPSETSGKKRKKRPWLMQLIVISTALCLLVGLVVGLAFNLGDWINEGEDKPDPNGVTQNPENGNDSVKPGPEQPVVDGADLMLGKPGLAVIREKHPLLRWIKLDVGAPKPVTINLSVQDQDDYFDFLEDYAPNDSLQVSLSRGDDGLLAIEALEEAPAQVPTGEPLEASISGADGVVLDGSTATFDLPFEGKLSYEIPADQEDIREKVKLLVEHLRENPSAPAPVKLLVEGEGQDRRIVGIESIDLSAAGSSNPLIANSSEPTGVDRVFVAGEPDFARMLPDQRIVEIKVDGVKTLPYSFREDEEENIKALIAFLEAGGKGLELKTKVDGDKITFLDFTIPAAPVSVDPILPNAAGPLGRTSVATYVFWLPGKKFSGTPVKWLLDLPNGSIRYEDASSSSLIDALLRAFDGAESATVWQAKFLGPKSFYTLGESDEDFEAFAVEVEKDRVDPETRASFSLKTAGSSRPIYSLKFDVKRGDYVDLDLTADMSKNAAERGFALRIPRGETECVDLYFLSNKHLSANHGHQPVDRGEQLTLEKSKLSFSPAWPAGSRFNVLTPGKQGSHKLYLAPAPGPGGTTRTDVHFASSMPTPQAFVTGEVQGIPSAIIMPAKDQRLASTILTNFEYIKWLRDSLGGQVTAYESDLMKKKAVLPNPQVYENIVSFGHAAARKSKFTPGELSYGEYLLNVTVSFAQETFALDVPQANAFRSKLLKLSDPKTFILNQQTLRQFWKAAFELLKKEADAPFAGFTYSEERAEQDVRTAFRLVNFFLHVENAFGMKDTDLKVELAAAREAFDSLQDGHLGKLQKELIALQAKPKGKAAAESFKNFNADYLTRAAKVVPPQSLVWAEYVKAMNLLAGDPVAVARFEAERKRLLQTEAWVKRLKDKISELQSAMATVVAAGGVQTSQAKERLAKSKWSLSLFKINPVSRVGGQAGLERVADIVTFR